jgi:hypothetical protein
MRSRIVFSFPKFSCPLPSRPLCRSLCCRSIPAGSGDSSRRSHRPDLPSSFSSESMEWCRQIPVPERTLERKTPLSRSSLYPTTLDPSARLRLGLAVDLPAVGDAARLRHQGPLLAIPGHRPPARSPPRASYGATAGVFAGSLDVREALRGI